LIQNVVARGKGSSMMNGHPTSWLDGITFDNVKLFLSSDTSVAYDKSVHALNFQMVKNLKLRNFEVFWEAPSSKRWRSALSIEVAKGVEIDNFSGGAAVGSDAAAIVFTRVEDGMIRNSVAREGTKTFLGLAGPRTTNIVLQGNDLRRAANPFVSSNDVARDAVILLNNLSRER
jgi:uncharacterized protein (DUF1684 family)